MQLQIYIIFQELWNKMSFKQRLKSSYIVPLVIFTYI